MPRSYLVRFGLARSVALFSVDPDSARAYPDLELLERGDRVVVRTHRGTELGEVLSTAPAGFDPDPPAIPHAGENGRAATAPLLRRATAADHERAVQVAARRGRDYESAAGVLDSGAWPIDLVDAEPLLDDGRTVLHYLGPHQLDASTLVGLMQLHYGLDVVLEPVGRDHDAGPAEDTIEVETLASADCGCGSKGGSCGSCATATGCAVRELVGKRQAQRASVIP